jgi:hypothetical protein
MANAPETRDDSAPKPAPKDSDDRNEFDADVKAEPENEEEGTFDKVFKHGKGVGF